MGLLEMILQSLFGFEFFGLIMAMTIESTDTDLNLGTTMIFSNLGVVKYLQTKLQIWKENIIRTMRKKVDTKCQRRSAETK